MSSRVLNYRRLHPRRVFSKPAGRCQAERTCQEIILSDPRCPDGVQTLRNTAFLNTYLIWTYYAFAQDDTAVGQSLLREAVRLKPTLREGQPSELVVFLVANTAADGSVDVKEHLTKIFAQLPSELASQSTQLDWAIARGYLLRGTQAVLWDRREEGHLCFARAAELGAEVDEPFMRYLAHQLLLFQAEMGDGATKAAFQRLADNFDKFGHASSVRRLKGYYSVNQAFQSYQAGKYAEVPTRVMQTVTNDPKYIMNRGVLSILLRSLTGTHPGRT